MSYRINEIFTSLQGEGVRAGTVNTFIRFAGCNLQCRADGPEGFDCDTEFNSFVRAERSEVVAAAVASWEEACGIGSEIRSVILTGGEPGIQVDGPLVEMLHAVGFYVAIETNGTQVLPDGIDWISCSPKSADHTLRIEVANEVRIVRHAGQGLPRTPIRALHYCLSPAFGADGNLDPGALATCVALCKANPHWRLSVQQHKAWGLR